MAQPLDPLICRIRITA